MLDLKRDAYVIIDSDNEVTDGYINVILNRPIPTELVNNFAAYYLYCFYPGSLCWTHSRPRLKRVVGSMIEIGWGVSSSPVGCILRLPEDFPCDPDQAVKRFEQELSSRKYDKSINRILCEHKADKGLTISLDKERYINPMFWGSLH